MTPRRVAVLAGGRSSEHEVSLASGESIREGLAEAGHEVLDVRLARDGTWWHGDEEVALRAGRGLLGAEVAFPILHGPFGEDGTVQGLLELLDVPYVGAGVLASGLCMDKLRFKDVMAQGGLPQVAYQGVRADELRAGPDAVGERLAALGLPVFVKPNRLGSSVGIAKVTSADALEGALAAAFAHDPQAIVEAAAGGLEVECSVIGNDAPLASEPGEIVIAPEYDWYDYEAKYSPGGMELVVPARISPAARDRVREVAAEAFRRSGCTGLARVDFFVDGDEVLLNELNTMPGQTRTSVFGKLFEASGMSFPELVDRLVELALERHAAERGFVH